MRKKTTKTTRFVAAWVLAAVVARGLGACGQGAPPAGESGGQSAAPTAAPALAADIDWTAVGWKPDPAGLEWKSDTSPVTLSYYANFSWFSLNWDDDTARRVTAKTGVALEFSKPVVDDNQKLNMMIAGKQLPDILTIDRNEPALQTMINAGMLWSLDDLIDQYAPKMREILPEEILQNYKSADGKTYRFTTWVQGKDWQRGAQKYNQIIGTNQPVWTVRKDYYDEAGRPEIKNPGDFIALLETIHAKHPDKIGFYPADGAMSSDRFQKDADLNNVGNQFGLSGNLVLVDGKIKWTVRDPKFLTAITALNTLYKKGLLTKDPFIDSKDVAKAKIEKGDVIAYSWALAECEKVPADNPSTAYEILPPFEDYIQVRTGAGWLATVISKSCGDPVRAIRFLEYLASAEGHQDVSWGVRGEVYSGDVVQGPHWNMVDGKPTMLPAYVADKNADWGGVASKNGLGEYWIACNELLWNLPWWDTANEKMNGFNALFGSRVVFRPELDIVNPDPASEEGVILQKAHDLLQQYSVKMIFAEDALAEYTGFIKELDALGMARVEAYWDGAYQANLQNMR
jgi:ABC-type glycerol-3-phosphate transport system substrate-binding protein